MSKLLGSDYLLLLLYLDNKKTIKGTVRLTKMMFLFNQEIAPLLTKKGIESDQLPQFIPYNFGPFSKDLSEQTEFFKNINFIKAKNIYAREEMAEVDDWEEGPFFGYDQSNSFNLDSKYIEYAIDDKGIKFVEQKILNQISPEILNIIERFKNKIVKTSIKNILYYVYSNYPDYAKKSIIKDEVLGEDNE